MAEEFHLKSLKWYGNNVQRVLLNIHPWIPLLLPTLAPSFKSFCSNRPSIRSFVPHFVRPPWSRSYSSLLPLSSSVSLVNNFPSSGKQEIIFIALRWNSNERVIEAGQSNHPNIITITVIVLLTKMKSVVKQSKTLELDKKFFQDHHSTKW